jgi:hypothetical protein
MWNLADVTNLTGEDFIDWGNDMMYKSSEE